MTLAERIAMAARIMDAAEAKRSRHGEYTGLCLQRPCPDHDGPVRERARIESRRWQFVAKDFTNSGRAF